MLERRRLHDTVLEYTRMQKQGAGAVAGSHTAVLDDRPEDTDVLHVLTREPRLPKYIVSRNFFFRVELDGRIMAYRHEPYP